jgi:hypothetical protein
MLSVGPRTGNTIRYNIHHDMHDYILLHIMIYMIMYYYTS